jgi:DNA repair exonuclease SbcCD nuclease subunit
LVDELGVAIHGQGFPKRAIPEDLSASYPSPRKGAFNIGVLHTSATGREGHATYAPCTLDGLIAKRYDYWALGHVHTREVLCTEPWIVFSGNMQGRHVRETGPKGCTLVTVNDGQIESVEHRDLHVIRWEHCIVDASGADTPDEVLLRVRSVLEGEYRKEGAPLAVRLTVTGSSTAHADLHRDPDRWVNEVRATLTDASSGDVWVEKVAFRTKGRQELSAMAGEPGPVGDLLRFIQAIERDPSQLPSVKEDLITFKAKLPPEIFEEMDPLDLEDPDVLIRLLEGARQLLIPRLVEDRSTR